MRHFLLSTAAVALAALGAQAGRAAEVTLIAPGGIRAAMTQLIAAYERETGNKVKPTFGSGGGTKAQVARGDRFDVPVVQPPYEEVLASGNVIAASATPLASVSVGVAVRPGTPKPDIATAEAVKRLLLAAQFIAYPDPARGAAAGVSMDATLQRLGIAEAMQPKIKLAQGGGRAMAMVAEGDVEIGLTFISEIITEHGIELVGPLPRDISPPTGFVAFVSAHAGDPAAAQALVKFLSSSAAAAVYRERGMVPAG